MGRRPLRALQVEVTSRCTRACAVCCQSGLHDRWQPGDLADEIWQGIRAGLSVASHVHLQGWGEPLLVVRLPAMVRDAHAAGCTVGVTTNGDLLSDAARWIVEERVDVLTVSLAGVGDRARDLRDGADAGAALDALAAVARRRGRRREPRLQVSFLLASGNVGDLEEVVRRAGEAGAGAVVINHLDCTPTRRIAALSLVGSRPLADEVRAAVGRAARAARRAGVRLRAPALAPRSMLVCALDPRRVVSIRWDGRAGPCVQLNLPVAGPVPRWVGDRTIEIAPPVFGWLPEMPLRAVIESPERRAFVASLDRRLEADREFRDSAAEARSWGAVALDELEAASRHRDALLAEHPFPPACRGCAKAAGW